MSIHSYSQVQKREIETLMSEAASDALSAEDYARLEGYLEQDAELETTLFDYLEGLGRSPESLPLVRQLDDRYSSSSGHLHRCFEPPATCTPGNLKWQNLAIVAGLVIIALWSCNNFVSRKSIDACGNRARTGFVSGY